MGYQGSAILLGLVEGAPVTSCTVVIVPNLTRGGTPYALIENVVAHADYRNRGFGKAILHAAVELAWAEGCYNAMLMTGSKEASTLGVYEAAGFEQSKTGFRPDEFPSDPNVRLILGLRLPNLMARKLAENDFPTCTRPCKVPPALSHRPRR